MQSNVCLAGFERFYFFVTIPKVDSQNVPSLGQTVSWGLANLILSVSQPPNVDLINVQVNDNKFKIKCFNLTILSCCSPRCALTHYLYQTQTINSCIYISSEFCERPHLNNFKRLLGAKEMENHMFIHRLDYTDYYYGAQFSCYQSSLCDHFDYIHFLLLLFFNLVSTGYAHWYNT